ncbi:hypothetical protein K9U65_10730 [Providencia stuartii]|uniref:hypothetical protein n=1 Tax=Providencia stuartii TaxID=588 RepID=UPI003316D8B8
MNNKYRRSIEHLAKTSSPETIIGAIQAIEDLFSASWLEQQNGHRLQILWARRDNVSTSELYSLGKSILKLSTHNQQWLETTAREIKRNINNCHGLLTEIIIIGSLSTEGGVVNPCKKSNPLYDYTVDFETGYQYKVSIKNFDTSIHEKEFNRQSGIIRETFKNFLKRKNESGKLIVILEQDLLTKNLVEEICCYIVFILDEPGSYSLSRGRITIIFSLLNEFNSRKLLPLSDTVMVLSKQHYNEQRNIKYKIKQANDDLLKDPDDEKSFKKLIIRLGASININLMNEYMQELASDWEYCGFDHYMLLQPTLALDVNENTTQILTTVNQGAKSFYPEQSNPISKLKNFKLLKFEFGVGGVSCNKVPMMLVNNNISTGIDLSAFYTYEKGDMYVEAERAGNQYLLEMSMVAPGVLLHSVVKNIVYSPICFPEDDKLLII